MDDPVACVREHAADAELVGLETGQTAGTLFRGLKSADLPVYCLETRHAHKVLSVRVNKTDRRAGLAEMMRVGWFKQAWLRGASAHAIRSSLMGRRLLFVTRRTPKTRSGAL